MNLVATTLSEFLADGTTVITWLTTTAGDILDVMMTYPVLAIGFFTGLIFVAIQVIQALKG